MLILTVEAAAARRRLPALVEHMWWDGKDPLENVVVPAQGW